jgi:hypothetical protein
MDGVSSARTALSVLHRHWDALDDGQRRELVAAAVRGLGPVMLDLGAAGLARARADAIDAADTGGADPTTEAGSA